MTTNHHAARPLRPPPERGGPATAAGSWRKSGRARRGGKTSRWRGAPRRRGHGGNDRVPRIPLSPFPRHCPCTTCSRPAIGAAKPPPLRSLLTLSNAMRPTSRRLPHESVAGRDRRTDEVGVMGRVKKGAGGASGEGGGEVSGRMAAWRPSAVPPAARTVENWVAHSDGCCVCVCLGGSAESEGGQGDAGKGPQH